VGTILLMIVLRTDVVIRGSCDGESVYRSQKDIDYKTCDIRTWKKHLFLDIFSTNICPIALPVHRNA
jgi:hypothetical protein